VNFQSSQVKQKRKKIPPKFDKILGCYKAEDLKIRRSRRNDQVKDLKLEIQPESAILVESQGLLTRV
jgi:hypothetical protein